MTEEINYEELEENIVSLAVTLNAAPGIHTCSSCGGHENPGSCGVKAPDWYVSFEVDRTDDGWLALEFLTWVVNHDRRAAGRKALLVPDSPPPFLNSPGRMLFFRIEGNGDDPDELACWIERMAKECFVAVIAPEGEGEAKL